MPYSLNDSVRMHYSNVVVKLYCTVIRLVANKYESGWHCLHMVMELPLRNVSSSPHECTLPFSAVLLRQNARYVMLLLVLPLVYRL